jgi:hypothetical protein
LPTNTILATSTVCSSQTVDEAHLEPEPLHVARDFGPAAVYHDRVHPDVLEKHDVARELLAQIGVGHRRPAVLDHDRAPVELADVGERLEQGGDVAPPRSVLSCRLLPFHVVYSALMRTYS